MQETWILSLGWEDPMVKGMATHTPVFLHGEFHEQRSLVGCSPWGCKVLDATEQMYACVRARTHTFAVSKHSSQKDSFKIIYHVASTKKFSCFLCVMG